MDKRRTIELLEHPSYYLVAAVDRLVVFLLVFPFLFFTVPFAASSRNVYLSLIGYGLGILAAVILVALLCTIILCAIFYWVILATCILQFTLRHLLSVVMMLGFCVAMFISMTDIWKFIAGAGIGLVFILIGIEVLRQDPRLGGMLSND